MVAEGRVLFVQVVDGLAAHSLVDHTVHKRNLVSNTVRDLQIRVFIGLHVRMTCARVFWSNLRTLFNFSDVAACKNTLSNSLSTMRVNMSRIALQRIANRVLAGTVS